MLEKYNKVLSWITYGFVVGVAFMIPFNFWVSQGGTFIVFFWLLTFDYKSKWQNMRNSPVMWLFLVLNVLYIAGCFWSENKHEAAISMMMKSALIGFPIVFAAMRLDYMKTKIVLQAFLAGLVCSSVFMIVQAKFYPSGNGADPWSYQEFSRSIMHPSYISLYYVIGIMICFHGILLRNVPMNRKVIAVMLVLLYGVMIFMLASKTGLISLIILVMFYIGYAVVRFKRYVVAGVTFVALLIGFFVCLQLFPSLKARLNEMTSVIESDRPIDPSEVESNRVRLLIWQQDLSLIAEHPLTGVGTGDVQDELMKKYADAGMTGAYGKKLNAHSQYFQTGIALGLPGLVLLVGILLASFTWSVRRRYGFAALFTVLLTFNFIPESMLQLQAGTFLFGFLFCFILFTADPAVISPKGSNV
jgi:O-antigen ligase